MNDSSAVQSVERTFRLLEIICENGKIGITEAAKLSDLSKATAFRLINSLCLLGYVQKSGDLYKPSVKILTLAAKIPFSDDVRMIFRPIIEKISDDCKETVHLVERNGNSAVYIDKIVPKTNFMIMASKIGMSVSLVKTAAGKAILSKLDDLEIEKIWNESCEEGKNFKDPAQFSAFMNDISKARETGYSIEIEENEPGVCCVAVPVCDIAGNYNNAISISAPVFKTDRKKLETLGKNLLKYLPY